jgi:hypothetical protein
MHLVLVGTSHHHAPVELRERVALDSEQAAALLPDDTFFSGPVQPGDAATLVWSEADAHHIDAA